ncbi:hypothetical protein V7150_25490, partial [Neobacillus drentensis]|uniref:hypothetical protein n=1 Tax=Neobacillus drentensis TaxID=220684 RepID=UPI002FFFE171
TYRNAKAGVSLRRNLVLEVITKFILNWKYVILILFLGAFLYLYQCTIHLTAIYSYIEQKMK